MSSVPKWYRGIKFDSTLEADWAYNLDALGIAWQDKPEAQKLPSGEYYRPDFFLPESRAWLEVKGPHDERLHKTQELARATYVDPSCRGYYGQAATFDVYLENNPFPHVEKILAELADGPTAVTLKVHAGSFADPTAPVVAVHRPRRRVRLTCESLGWLRLFTLRVPTCATCQDSAWRLTLVGRAAQFGFWTWETLDPYGKPEGLSLVVKCTTCHRTTFSDRWDSHGSVCRFCSSYIADEPKRSWWSGNTRFGTRFVSDQLTIPFIRLP